MVGKRGIPNDDLHEYLKIQFNRAIQAILWKEYPTPGSVRMYIG